MDSFHGGHGDQLQMTYDLHLCLPQSGHDPVWEFIQRGLRSGSHGPFLDYVSAKKNIYPLVI